MGMATHGAMDANSCRAACRSAIREDGLATAKTIVYRHCHAESRLHHGGVAARLQKIVAPVLKGETASCVGVSRSPFPLWSSYPRLRNNGIRNPSVPRRQLSSSSRLISSAATSHRARTMRPSDVTDGHIVRPTSSVSSTASMTSATTSAIRPTPVTGLADAGSVTGVEPFALDPRARRSTG